MMLRKAAHGPLQ